MQVQQRLLKEKETKIRKALERLRQKRRLLGRQRRRREFPVIAVVGYTNCGESPRSVRRGVRAALAPRTFAPGSCVWGESVADAPRPWHAEGRPMRQVESGAAVLGESQCPRPTPRQVTVWLSSAGRWTGLPSLTAAF